MINYFLLKTPNNLHFIEEEHRPEDLVQSLRQVRYSGNKSNTKLVLLSDGEWYIKNGSDLYHLRSADIKSNSIARLNKNGGEILETINKKWFMDKNARN
ncbi:hypothetical protein ENBRE01_1923 [Enteropsectra breve]|nr:hypothetical protein ENBRE01_1923 [Enteropsectra breve]